MSQLQQSNLCVVLSSISVKIETEQKNEFPKFIDNI